MGTINSALLLFFQRVNPKFVIYDIFSLSQPGKPLIISQNDTNVIFFQAHRGRNKESPGFPHRYFVLRECTLSIQEEWGAGGGREGEGFYIFFKQNFVDQETTELNILWSSNFFRKYFMVPAINFSFLFKAYLQQYFREILTAIFRFQITKEVNIHNNIKKIIFK